jgi:hypothetical protein
MARSAGSLAGAFLLAACSQLATPSPSSEGIATFQVTGTWQRCHQMGACKYTVDLATPTGVETVELLRLSAVDDAGALTPDAGLPAKLTIGAHALTVVSTMYGDTLGPNGEQTVLGEEARCSADFVVDGTTSRVMATVALVPGTCSVAIEMDRTQR